MFYVVSMWIVNACNILWACSGILCWPIWARNLWGGEEAAEKWPIETDFGSVIFFRCLIWPCCMVIIAVMAIVLIPVGIARGLWARIHRKRVNIVEAGEVEGGIGCESGSVTDVESFTDK